jgi:ribosomal protein S18 acetylase RimI-like enzyme
LNPSFPEGPLGSLRGPDPRGHLVDLRTLDRADLEPLLTEESNFIWESLHWQVSPLEQGPWGIAWVDENRIQGYLTLVLDGGTARPVRLFVSRHGPLEAVESALLWAAIEGAFALPGVERFSGEIFMLAPATMELLLLQWPDRVGIRCLMESPWSGTPRPPEQRTMGLVEHWCQDLLPAASSLLVDAYSGMADVRLGLTYGTMAEALHTLESITTRAAVGRFEAKASFAARDAQTKELTGFVLACRMGEEIGHIAQLAVAPRLQRQGLGVALLVRALDGLRALGCRASHLVVYKANSSAFALYQSMGFRETHRFPDLRLERSGARLT